MTPHGELPWGQLSSNLNSLYSPGSPACLPAVCVWGWDHIRAAEGPHETLPGQTWRKGVRVPEHPGEGVSFHSPSGGQTQGTCSARRENLGPGAQNLSQVSLFCTLGRSQPVPLVPMETEPCAAPLLRVHLHTLLHLCVSVPANQLQLSGPGEEEQSRAVDPRGRRFGVPGLHSGQGLSGPWSWPQRRLGRRRVQAPCSCRVRAEAGSLSGVLTDGLGRKCHYLCG